MALDQLIHAERLRADIAAYRRTPPTQDEVALASFGDTGGLGDDTDCWKRLPRRRVVTVVVRRGEVWLADADKTRP